MNFINNWMQPVTLAAGATVLDLDLVDGRYRLTLSDSDTAPTRWEIVDAAIEGGEAVLSRGLEGTLDQDWPEGSVIYAGITAGILGELYSRLNSLEARVTTLERAAAADISLAVTVGLFVESASTSKFGFSLEPPLGSIAPSQVALPGYPAVPVRGAAYEVYSDSAVFTFTIDGEYPQDALSSIELVGGPDLQAAQADYYSGEGLTLWWWSLASMQPAWAEGEQRTITLKFA